MCTVLTACSNLRYSNAALRVVKICVQFLLIVVFYGTVLLEQKLLKYMYSAYCLDYCTLLYCRGKNCYSVCTVLTLVVFDGTVLHV